MSMPSSSTRTPWLLFAAAAATAIALFFIPGYIIRPFTHQSAPGLALAMALRHRAPWGTLIAAFLALTFAILVWRRSNWWRRTILVLVMVVVTFSTVMARLNYFEWMFHPVDDIRFESAATSKLDPSEMILAVRFGDDARAYPISQMAYHHMVNDVVGGVPIVATY